MTDFIDRTSDDHLTEHSQQAHDENTQNEMDESGDETESDDSVSKSSSGSSGSWSIDDSIEFMQTSHKPLFDELPIFAINSASPSGHSLSSSVNEPISLFNLSISPISSVEDLTRVNDNATSGKYTKDSTQQGNDTIASGYDEDERISLDEITAHINTPPSALSRSNKRLNLETIFEDVFLETPKKRRFNGFKRFNSWRIETFQEITNEDRISSYVFEQQQSQTDHNARLDTNILCNAFDDKINLNT